MIKQNKIQVRFESKTILELRFEDHAKVLIWCCTSLCKWKDSIVPQLLVSSITDRMKYFRHCYHGIKGIDLETGDSIRYFKHQI